MCYRNVIAGHSTAFGVRFVQQSRSFTLRLFTQHFLGNLHLSHLSPFAERDVLQQHKVCLLMMLVVFAMLMTTMTPATSVMLLCTGACVV